jgi:hypothetical protein
VRKTPKKKRVHGSDWVGKLVVMKGKNWFVRPLRIAKDEFPNPLDDPLLLRGRYSRRVIEVAPVKWWGCSIIMLKGRENAIYASSFFCLARPQRSRRQATAKIMSKKK